MNNHHKDLLDLFNHHIEEINWNRDPQGLYGPIGYILEVGGKRFRPILTLAASNAWTDDLEKALNAATAIEIFHNFTLLHDDIMDDASLRRGRPSVHTKYDVNTGILSGDAMMIMAMQYLQKACDDNNRNEILDSFLQTSLEVCEGQQMDVDFEMVECPSQQDYIEMIRKKTAILPGVALKIGALIGGGTQKDAEALFTFGECLGLAFQIQDDILDTYGDQTFVGKTIGGDIAQNKKTILYILAYNSASQDDKKLLSALFEHKSSEKEKIDQVMGIFNKYSALDMAVELKNEYHTMSLESLSKLSINKDKKMAFDSMAQLLLNRKF